MDNNKFQRIIESALVKTGFGKLKRIVINSHSSGTIKIIDGLYNGAAATGTLTSDATNVADGETVTIGTITYRYKDTPAQAYDVKRGADAATSLDNLKLAINQTGLGDGSDYYAGTYQNPDVIATTNTNTTQVVVARKLGTAGNSIATTETSAHLSWGAATLASGTGSTGRVMHNTMTLGASERQIDFEENFDTALLIVLGGTADITVIYD